jgi:hypothetical protein
MSTQQTTSGIGAVAGISIMTAMCADSTSAVDYRDGYALGAVVAIVAVVASLGLRAVDHASASSDEKARAQRDASDSLDENVFAPTA